jgi:hypothetical protein
LAEFFRHFVNSDQATHPRLKFATFTYNTTPHTATGYTPFELIFGRKPELPSAVRTGQDPVYNFDDFVSGLKYRLQTTHKIARQKMDARKIVSKKYYDRTTNDVTFNVNDLVLLKREARENKLSALYEGPYKVVLVNSPVNTTTQKGKKTVRVHNNRLIPFTERN